MPLFGSWSNGILWHYFTWLYDWVRIIILIAKMVTRVYLYNNLIKVCFSHIFNQNKLLKKYPVQRSQVYLRDVEMAGRDLGNMTLFIYSFMITNKNGHTIIQSVEITIATFSCFLKYWVILLSWWMCTDTAELPEASGWIKMLKMYEVGIEIVFTLLVFCNVLW